MGTLRRVNDDGIVFRSHIDGSEHLFTPESAILNQHGIGADIIMCFDQCVFFGRRTGLGESGNGAHPPVGGCVPLHPSRGVTGRDDRRCSE